MLRVTAIKQKYNADTEKTVATYEYNELGQLIDKKLGVNGAAFLQSVDYRYNILGQLLSINNSKLIADNTDPNANTNDDTNDVFGEELSYNVSNAQIGSTGTWSGQLTAVKWMSLNGSNVKSNERSYKYTYDNLGRFTQALYAERLSTATPTTSFTLNPGGFDEKSITYDENGNIQSLQRNSSTVGGSGGTLIDNLTYAYDTNNANKLLKVTDASSASAGFRNYTGSTGNYTYNKWGNLESDPSKGITAIAYNVLNRVDKVTLTYPSATGRYIDYTYDASGKLLRKRQYDNSVLQKTTDYIDGFVYTTAGAGTAQLDYFGMPEGRVRNTGGATITLIQEFIITDHQGNARVSFEDNGSGVALVKQENSYYAFGMSMTSTMALPTAPNKNLYNGGSEWQNDYSDQPDWQQTFYRNYDQTIGRFLAVDPMAEATDDMSVYQYAGNNPVMNNDPLGDKHISSQYPLGMPEPVTIVVRNFGGQSRMTKQDYFNGIDSEFWGNGRADVDNAWLSLILTPGSNNSTYWNKALKLVNSTLNQSKDVDTKLINLILDISRSREVSVNKEGLKYYLPNENVPGASRIVKSASFEEIGNMYVDFLLSTSNSENVGDMVGFSLNGNIVDEVGVGVGLSIFAITHGDYKGAYATATVSIRAGLDDGVSVSTFNGYYLGKDQNNPNPYEYLGHSVDYTVKEGNGAYGWASFGKFTNIVGTTSWIGVGQSWGWPAPGISVGYGETYKLYGFK
jgi:RHS repeat-associated protein